MKTPRELLLGRHRAVEPRLDEARQNALAGLSRSTSAASAAAPSWLDWLKSLRWHFAGIGAVWLAVAFLNTGGSAETTTAVAKKDIPSAHQLVTAMRQSRQQLLQLIEPPAAEPAAAPPRRSDSRPFTALA